MLTTAVEGLAPILAACRGGGISHGRQAGQVQGGDHLSDHASLGGGGGLEVQAFNLNTETS